MDKHVIVSRQKNRLEKIKLDSLQSSFGDINGKDSIQMYHFIVLFFFILLTCFTNKIKTYTK